MKTCNTCGVEKPLDDFYWNKRDGHGARCKACLSSKAKKDYKENPEKYRERLYKKKYGITIADYNAILEEQDGKCAICGTSDPRGQGVFHIDHNHVTGKVRGLLCCDCNTGIGSLKDSPEVLLSALNYLEENGHYG